MDNTFSLFLGLKPNLTKCEIAGIRALKGVQVTSDMKCIDLCNEAIKTLGTYFSYNSSKVELKDCILAKIILDKKQQLQENQILIKVLKPDNRHGLVQNIVYFLNKNNKISNPKIVLHQSKSML